MRQGYHLSPGEKERIRDLYADGMSINEVAERVRVTRNVVSKLTMDLRRKNSGYRDRVCRLGKDCWTPVREQLDRIVLLEKAKAGDPLALRILNAKKLMRWVHHGEVIVGEYHMESLR
jgi:hypothetical protein